MVNVTITSPEELLAAQGHNLGSSSWLRISQKRVNLFSDAIGQQQWTHIDSVQSTSDSFGEYIANSYLALSLTTYFIEQLLEIQNLTMGVNYGCDNIRFLAPVPTNSRIRGHGKIINAEQKGSFIQVTIRMIIELEETKQPTCTVDMLGNFIFSERRNK
ncbi:MaoC family dehydratase [Photobacterium alginatilyticum]|uniref:MaoC family dehydratase n=1 Tax=Photobacterium alginatilyticum TaxID=1775171 RepID=A0ABW9YDF3_9GAMM|nr:MaoC family dehydratase [Photobacterium alginatilyticum]NBI51229.1 MaoC family dehydratase [Photobacterium alginatilyticum]